MTRRQFARNTIGALVGASVIPAFGEKPKLVIGIAPAAQACRPMVAWVDLNRTIRAVNDGDLVSVWEADGYSFVKPESSKPAIFRNGGVIEFQL